MSIKSSRILQMISVILYGCSLVGIILAMVLQRPILNLFYHLPQEMLEQFAIPIAPIIFTMIYFILALLTMVVLFTRPRGPLWLAILMIILFILMGAVLSPLASTFVTAAYARMGSVALAANSSLSGLCSTISGAFGVPAMILMFLALGASLNPKSAVGDSAAQSYPGGQAQSFPGGPAPRPQQFRETDTDHVQL